MERCYMAVTDDAVELPLAVFDSPAHAARWSGLSLNTIYEAADRERRGYKTGGHMSSGAYKIVSVDL